uniref:PREDICTED: similar to pol polyprotein putative n=1 Tax=Albugo laibachii Nc14 TaxID=890382 RepID=F0WDL3_9STRA|nr:PREDICTED: similar to pol polyprotein putative [Albugo laibachii Nc14]|eukprot:CCA19288.1 PREDICTED: similar to pol polyprotein putative [Albugo laibachii Nc14]
MGAKHVPVSRVNALMLKDPKTYREAMKDPRVKQWEEAMRTEIEALEQNNTWDVIQKPREAKLLHSKGVYKLKMNADGTIERYKSRLVARGDEQVYGVDYTFTFSAVMEMISGKVILAVSRIWGVPARPGDVPSAYIKAEKEDNLKIILHIPQGKEFDHELLQKLGVRDKRQVALKLKKGLYSLKQSGRLWNMMLHDILKSLGFTQCYTDSCLYIKTEADGKTLVGIYVDDVLVTGTSDLGVVTKFLGIAFKYNAETGWALNQENNIEEMLEKFGLSESAAVRVPMGGDEGDEETALLLSGGCGSPQRPTVQTFQSLVGSLLWIDRCTRPDIAFAVHGVMRRSHAPTEGDWRLEKKIAKYLKGTKGLKFMIHGDKAAMKAGVLVEAYSDADNYAYKSDRNSVSGGALMMGGMVVVWVCKKKNCVALSTMEAEFVVASQTAAEMMGIMELLQEIGVPIKLGSIVHIDNQASIA